MTIKSENSESSRTAEEIVLEDPSGNSPLLICSILENQRPLKGVAGELDWRLRGFLSRFVINGRIRGTKGEFTYIPIRRHSSLRHLLLVGLGKDSDNDEQTLKKLAQTVLNLKFSKVAISRSSFPLYNESGIKKALKGIDVEFIQ